MRILHLRTSHSTNAGDRSCVRRFLWAAGVGAVLAGVVPAAIAQANAPAERWVAGRLLVLPRPGLSDAEFAKILKPHGGTQVGKIDKIDVRVVQIQAGSEKAVEALLKNNKHLKFVERDVLLNPQFIPNDPNFAAAWHLAKIGAPVAWDISMGAGITIAILDTGVQPDHPDLQSKLVSGWNIYYNSADTSDTVGHGTLVAGAAAAATNNAIGVAGVAPNSMIMPVQVTGTAASASLSMLANGITWAADHGAKVANLSFAAAGGYATVQSAAQYMKNKGGVVVTAAGNSGTQQTFAASTTNIVVSNTNSSDVIDSTSSYGQFVDLGAPGFVIWTSKLGSGYTTASGTSLASPVVAGVAALVMAANRNLGPADVEKILFSTAVDLGTPGFDVYYGYGRVNAAAAVAAALTAVPSDSTAPSVSISSPAASSKISGLVAVDVAASDNVGVSRVDLMLGSTKIGSDITGPYGFSWDSTTVADGNVTLTAYAYDAAGNSSAKAVTVSVANATSTSPAPSTDTTAPVPAFSSPLSGSKVGNSVTVSGSATDNVRVASLRLAIDGVQVASVSGASLSYSWNTRKLSAGTHTLLLQATDAAGNTGIKTISVTK